MTGKPLVSIIVITLNTAKLTRTCLQSVVRNIVRVLDFIPIFYGLGAMVSSLDRYKRRLGDIVVLRGVLELA